MKQGLGFILVVLALLVAVCFAIDLEAEPQLMPGMQIPGKSEKYHCEGGGGHAPHDHNDEAHKHYMEQPKFLDGGSGGWFSSNNDVSQGGMGKVPEGGAGVSRDKDEL